MGHGISDSWLVNGDLLPPNNPNLFIHLVVNYNSMAHLSGFPTGFPTNPNVGRSQLAPAQCSQRLHRCHGTRHSWDVHGRPSKNSSIYGRFCHENLHLSG